MNTIITHTPTPPESKTEETSTSTPTPTSKIEKTPTITSTTMDPPERIQNVSIKDSPNVKSTDHKILLNNNLLMGMVFVISISLILIYKISRTKKIKS